MSITTGEAIDYTLQAKAKAIVFTHINLKPERIRRKGPEACLEEYVPLFERYLKCRNVGLVYMYLSSGVEEVVRTVVEGVEQKRTVAEGVVRAVAEDKDIVIPPQVLMNEAQCLDILQLAEDRAREAYPNGSLRFIYVATFQLVSLLRNLHGIDPDLVGFLFGKITQNFGYDSPKFIEAVVRIARGQHPRLAFYPVLRFDEDVQVCEKSLDVLLAEYEDFLDTTGNPYFFFSGGYGDPDEPDKLDPINARAVRVHWFVDQNFQPDDRKIKIFWRDLGEIGATQVSVDDSPSTHGEILISKRGLTANRDIPQAISGAGLIMSLPAIRDLPPFMNMNRLIVWVDDHLKRQLHEAIGHIFTHELESVAEARFEQDRHPDGITTRDMAWAKDDYFERLLAGCMMDALISQPVRKENGVIREPTEFSAAIGRILANPTVEIDCEAMKPELQEYAGQRYEQVLSLWQTPEFEGTALYDWVCDKARDTTHREERVKETVEDACAYLELVQRWQVSFAAAIGRLNRIGNLWLFERV